MRPPVESGRSALGAAIAAAALLAAAPASGQPRIIGSADGALLDPLQIDSALHSGTVALVLGAGERVRVAGIELAAEQAGRALLALSSEFLTVAVTAGVLRLGDGPKAGPGQALLLALDGNRTQRLAFDARRLAASISPGARPILEDDLEQVARSQRRAAFWGAYEPLRVNARAPAPPALEDARQTYLSAPAIVAQRRAAAGTAPVVERGRMAVDAFLAAYAGGDAHSLAALLDPEPFLAGGGAVGVNEGRLQAASALLADARLRPILAGSPAVSMTPDGAAALLESGAQRWRLALIARDRAIFIQSLEPTT